MLKPALVPVGQFDIFDNYSDSLVILKLPIRRPECYLVVSSLVVPRRPGKSVAIQFRAGRQIVCQVCDCAVMNLSCCDLSWLIRNRQISCKIAICIITAMASLRAREYFAQIPAGVRKRLTKADYSLSEARSPQGQPIAKLMTAS